MLGDPGCFVGSTVVYALLGRGGEPGSSVPGSMLLPDGDACIVCRLTCSTGRSGDQPSSSSADAAVRFRANMDVLPSARGVPRRRVIIASGLREIEL